MLSLRTLGLVRLIAAEGELLHGRRKELVLLAYLARRAPRPVPRAELAALLWGERPEANARQSLRQVLLNLKRVVDGLDIETESVALPDGALDLDVTAFERDLAAGRLADAAQRWEGDFLADAEDAGGEAYHAWLETERQALRTRLAWALERLVGQAEARGEVEAAVRWAQRWTEVLPLEEPPQARLIQALRRAGRTGDALAQQAAFVTRLHHELGTEPTAQFLQLAATPAREPPRARPTPGSTALLTPEFVGRSTARTELAAAWEAARGGAATLVLVEGEGGIGKTRLCEEFLRGLTQRDDPVLVLRAGGRPDDPTDTRSLLRELATALAQAPGVSGAPTGALQALGALAPALRERFPRLPDAAGSGWAPDEALAQVLAAAASEQPVVVFVEDVTPGATRDILSRLVKRLREAPILVLVTGEPDHLAPLHAVHGARPMRLHPLTPAEAELLVGSMLKLSPEELPGLVERLQTETGGLPLYLVETLRALLDEGELVPDSAGVWRAPKPLQGRPLPVPTSVREAFSRRLAQLSPPARRLVEAAATLAAPAKPELLRATAGLSAADCELALEELLGRRLLREGAGPPGTYLLAHELGRRAAYELIPATRRRVLHRAALDALKARARTDEAAHAAISYHRSRAGSAAFRWAGKRRAPMVAGALVALAVAAAAAVRLYSPHPPGRPPASAPGTQADTSRPPIPVNFDLLDDSASTIPAPDNPMVRYYARIIGIEFDSTTGGSSIRGTLAWLRGTIVGGDTANHPFPAYTVRLSRPASSVAELDSIAHAVAARPGVRNARPLRFRVTGG